MMISDIFEYLQREDDKKKFSRRTLCKLALIIGLAKSINCAHDEIDGVPVARQTDGQIMPATAQYFNNLRAINSYDNELADLLNEVWVKEMNRPINRHIGILFVNESPEHSSGEYDEKTRVDWTKPAYEKVKTIRIENNGEQNYVFGAIGHELGHYFSRREVLPIFRAHRLSTMAVIHFPEFGRDTNYSLFTTQNTETFIAANTIMAGLPDSRVQHSLCALTTLLALNQTNGSFPIAHDELSRNTARYLQQAKELSEHCQTIDGISDTHIVDPDSPTVERIQIAEYYRLVLTDLWHKVAHQTIKFNVEQNPLLDAATKAELTAGLKKAARFPRRSVLGTPTNPPHFARTEEIVYKEGFAAPLSFLVTPTGYDYSIPKGI